MKSVLSLKSTLSRFNLENSKSSQRRQLQVFCGRGNDMVVDDGLDGAAASAANRFSTLSVPEPDTFWSLLSEHLPCVWSRRKAPMNCSKAALVPKHAQPVVLTSFPMALFMVFYLTLFIEPRAALPAGHREAPITALDPKADITDVYAFRSYEPGRTSNVTLIMCVDPFLEPANGPNWFPFDPDILYEIKIDNNDAV